MKPPMPPSPARRTQAERREEAESRLLEAALGIVARRGSVRMTLAEVGEAAGYSRGLPAHRFGSKAGLLRSLAPYVGERFRRQREAAPARAPGLDAIRGAVSVYFGRDGDWVSTRALLVMLTESFMEGSEVREPVLAYNRAARSFFEDHIRHAIGRGEARADLDPAATAILLLGAMRGVMLQWLSDETFDLGRIRDQLLALVDRTFAP